MGSNYNTTTKTSTRTKAIAAVAVVAALGLIGYAAAVGISEFVFKPDLTVAITESSNPVNDGDSVVHTVTISNTGKKATSSVQTVVTLPSELTYVSYATSSTSFTCSVAGQTVTCTGNLPAGKSGNVQITSTATQACGSASVTVAAEVDPLKKIAEKNENNNSDSEPLTIDGNTDCAETITEPSEIDIWADIAESEDTTMVGDEIIYHVYIFNNGNISVSSVDFEVKTSSEMAEFTGYEDWTDGKVSCILDSSNTVYSCTGGPLETGEEGGFRVDFAVPTSEWDVLACGETDTTTITVNVDPENRIEEDTNKENQQVSETSTVTGVCL